MGSTWWGGGGGGVQRIGEVKISAAGNRENYKGGFPTPAPSKLFKSFETEYETVPHLSHNASVVKLIHFLRLVKLSCVMVEIITWLMQSVHWLLLSCARCRFFPSFCFIFSKWITVLSNCRDIIHVDKRHILSLMRSGSSPLKVHAWISLYGACLWSYNLSQRKYNQLRVITSSYWHLGWRNWLTIINSSHQAAHAVCQKLWYPATSLPVYHRRNYWNEICYLMFPLNILGVF